MYRSTFRLMETADEHIYDGYSYHWANSAWDLSDEALEKVYRTNALKLLSERAVSVASSKSTADASMGGETSNVVFSDEIDLPASPVK